MLLYTRVFPSILANSPALDRAYPWCEAHSWTHWGLQIRGADLGYVSTNTPDITGTPRTLTAGSARSFVMGALGNERPGIALGFGNTVDRLNATVMVDEFTHGNGIGQLVYGAMVRSGPGGLGPSFNVVLSREFENQFANTQTATEQALYSYDGSHFFLLAIDHLGAPIAFVPFIPTTVQYLLTAQGIP